MKILYIAPLDSIHSQRWVSHFIGLGHDVEVLDTAAGERTEFEGAPVHALPWQLPKGKLGKLLAFGGKLAGLKSKMAKLVSRIKPEVIHVHWMTGPYALAAAGLGFHPLMATPWGSDLLVEPKKSVLRRRTVKRLVEACDRFCCDAEHLADALVDFGATRDSVSIIYFGTDTRLFHGEAGDLGLAAELGFAPDAPLILSNRALREVYNVETLVRAVPPTIEKRPEARFVIVGGGDQREMLESLAAELGVADHVHFAGRLSDEDMIRYTASATIYVSTSLSDGGLAASTAEAMASEVPVVISDFGENADWVEHGTAGRLFPLRDRQALSDHLVELLESEKERRRLGVAGRTVITDRNDRYKEMAKVEKMYRELAAQSFNKDQA